MSLNDQHRADLNNLVRSHGVVLFMKGSRRSPQCGFSATVVGILDKLAPEYETVDILKDPSVREGMKEFSNWPTFPQLYVKGEFVGGCDIVKEMDASGELARLFGVERAPVKAPGITVTSAAAKAFHEAAGDAGGDVLRLAIDDQFRCDLVFGPKAAGDVVLTSSGVAIHFDPSSAGRADGILIDFVETSKGMAFKIDNPNEPARVKSIAPKALKALMDDGQVELFDVRPDAERALASIALAKKLDSDGQRYLFGLKKDTAIALHCHHGMRSRAAADQLLREGFANVYNLEGGIDAWSQDVDPSVPRY